MKKILSTIATIAALALATLATPAMATTACTSTVTQVKTDAGTGATSFYFLLANGIYVQVAFTDPAAARVSEVAGMAYATQSTVVVTFAASGVSCTTAATRTDMVSVSMSH